MSDATGRFLREYRLLRPAEFQRVFGGEPCRFNTPYFTMLTLPNGLTHARLGIALTKRSIKRAVSRNRIRRQLRESFRLNHDLITGMDVIVLGRSGIEQATNALLRETVDRSWRGLVKRCKSS